jgi:hypothetical protein
MASGVAAVALAVGLGGATVAGCEVAVGVARPLQAASRVKMINKKTSFVRTGFLQTRMQVFYLILKFQSAFRAL